MSRVRKEIKGFKAYRVSREMLVPLELPELLACKAPRESRGTREIAVRRAKLGLLDRKVR